MTPTRTMHSRRGAALIASLIVAFAVAAMAVGAIMISSNARLTTSFSVREASMQAAANGGLEIVRDSLNGGIFDSLLPVDNFTTIATSEAVLGASGDTLPGYSRALYVGRTGGRTGGAATAGQYGSNFASALSVVSDTRGAVAARRLLLTQESWSKFAVAINRWPGTAVYGCSESISGPFHSNDVLRLQSGCSSPRVLFTGPVSVVGSIANQSSGTFQSGVRTGVPAIQWPTPARINLMETYAINADAANGDYDITAPAVLPGSHTPALRIEFLTIDANGNGTIEWDEGYMRVWRAATGLVTDQLSYVTARRWSNASTTDPNMQSPNCGATVRLAAEATARFVTARELWNASTSAQRDAGVRWLLTNGATGARPSSVNSSSTPTGRQCFLGGDPRLFNLAGNVTPDSTVTMNPSNGALGFWIKRRTGPLPGLASRPDAAYLIPLGANPNFKGVVFVTGDVAVSGTMRGRASIFATGNVVLADDLRYHNAPGTRCDAEGDILGAIATLNVLVSDNNVQTPFRVNSTMWGGYDDTPRDEQYHMFYLAAGNANAGTGNMFTTGLNGVPGVTPAYRMTGTFNASATAEACGGAPAGCIRITGGQAMGRVEYYTYSPSGSTNAYGYAEAHSYDACGAVNPPPYFPTTGRFIESRYYEIDPVWLNRKGIDNYFADLRGQ